MRIADPRPPMCSACLNTKQQPERYVDFENVYDGVPVLDPNTRAVAVEPASGVPMLNDSIILCEGCVKQAAALLAYKPEQVHRLLQQIRVLELAAEHWKERAARSAHALAQDVPDSPRRRERSAV